MNNNEASNNYKNRVIEVKRMRIGDVSPNPRNWKIHPDKQKKALDDILSRIGIAGVLPAYYSERNEYQLTFIDGHARRELDEDALWDIAILDVTDEEADLLLSVYDPIGELAVTNHQAYNDLLKSIQTDSEVVMELVSKTAEDAGMYFSDYGSQENELNDNRELVTGSARDGLHSGYDDDENIPNSFPEYKEDIEKEVQFIECPSCGHRFPK